MIHYKDSSARMCIIHLLYCATLQTQQYEVKIVEKREKCGEKIAPILKHLR